MEAEVLAGVNDPARCLLSLVREGDAATMTLPFIYNDENAHGDSVGFYHPRLLPCIQLKLNDCLEEGATCQIQKAECSAARL